VKDVRFRHRKRLDHLHDPALEDAMCEMNVIEQVGNVAESNVMQDAWRQGQAISVHGWIYGLKDGLLHDLDVTIASPDEVGPMLSRAYKRYPELPSTQP
jgi:carbonic anhydrase